MSTASNATSVRPDPATQATKLAKGLALACLSLIFALPFLVPVRRAPIPTLDGEMLSATLLFLAAVMSGIAVRRGVRLSWPLPLFLLFLMLVTSIHWLGGRLSYSYSVTTLFMTVAALFLAYGVGRWCRQNGLSAAALHWIAGALVVGALLSVGIQVMQLLDVGDLPTWLYFQMVRTTPLQTVANVGQPNQLAAYLALSIPAAVYLAGNRDGSRLAELAVALTAVGIAFTLSRMGLLMLVLLTAWVLLSQSGGGRKRIGFAVAIWAGYLVGSFLGPLLVVEQGGVGSVVDRVLGAAYSDRLVMWTDAIRVALAHPWLGVGPGEYASAQYWVTSASPGTLGTPYAHNAALQLGAEFGVPVAIAFVALNTWWLTSDARRRWADPVVSTILMMGGLLILHGMLEWSLWVLFVSIPAALLFALGEPDARVGVTADPKATLVPIGLAGLLYLPLFFLDYDGVSRVASYLDQEQRESRAGNFNSLVGVLQIGDATYFKPQADRMILSVLPIKAPVDEEQLRRTERVMFRLPDVQTIALHITALALAGRADEALPHAERLRAFAITSERYAVAERQILRKIASQGEEADKLRARLASLR